MVTSWSVNSHCHSAQLHSGNTVDLHDRIRALKAVGDSLNHGAYCNTALHGAPKNWGWSSLGKG